MRTFVIWHYQKENNQKRVVESAEQIGISPPPKWECVRNAVNQNYPIEHAQTVDTIKDALLFHLKKIKPFLK